VALTPGKMENLPELKREPASPGFLTLAPWVGVNSCRRWTAERAHLADAAKLLTELNTGQFEPSEAVAAKARSLVEGAATEFDKVRAIGRFTQQVKYAAIQNQRVQGRRIQAALGRADLRKVLRRCKTRPT